MLGHKVGTPNQPTCCDEAARSAWSSDDAGLRLQTQGIGSLHHDIGWFERFGHQFDVDDPFVTKLSGPQRFRDEIESRKLIPGRIDSPPNRLGSKSVFLDPKLTRSIVDETRGRWCGTNHLIVDRYGRAGRIRPDHHAPPHATDAAHRGRCQQQDGQSTGEQGGRHVLTDPKEWRVTTSTQLVISNPARSESRPV